MLLSSKVIIEVLEVVKNILSRPSKRLHRFVFGKNWGQSWLVFFPRNSRLPEPSIVDPGSADCGIGNDVDRSHLGGPLYDQASGYPEESSRRTWSGGRKFKNAAS